MGAEKEGGAGGAEDMFEADRGGAQAAGTDTAGPGGRGSEKELTEDMGAAGGSPAETDRWVAGRSDAGLGM